MKKRTVIRLLIIAACLGSISYLSWSGVRLYDEYQDSTESVVVAQVTAEQPASADETGTTDSIDQPLDGVTIDSEVIVATNQVNILTVPSMQVNSRVHEGNSVSTLNKGIWRIPGSSTPDKGGNTVIAAHRWKWLPISHKSFYDIDKVKVDDVITMQWNGKTYSYKVSKISTVTPDKVDILQNSEKPKLTLFSCAPLFSSKYRLVVEADLMAT